MPYSRLGLETVVNTNKTGGQWAPSVAGFAGGGFVAAWSTTDVAQDGAGYAIKLQRYDAAGLPTGPEILVNTAATGDQRAPAVTTLASGGYVVTWQSSDVAQDGGGTAIKAQVFDSAGVRVGTEFRVNSQGASDQTRPSITELDDGGFVITWETADPAQDGHSSAIKGQIYGATGVPEGGEFLVNRGALGFEHGSQVTSLAGGGFLATWTLHQGQSADVYAQIFDANGLKLGAQFQVNTVAALNQDMASATQISGGRFVVAWQSSASLTTYDRDIKAQIFAADGTRIGSEFTVSTTRSALNFGNPIGSGNPTVEDLPGGGFLVTWNTSGDPRGSVRGQFFNDAGVRVGEEIVINTTPNRSVSDADVAVDGNGNIFVLWEGFGGSATSDQDVRGQIFTTASGPVIVSGGGGEAAAATAAENQLAAATVQATPGSSTAALTYGIVGGADAGYFAINAATGALTFRQAPNFEARGDTGSNGVYDVVVSVTDGTLYDVQAIAVTVTNVAEAPTFNSSDSVFYIRENVTGTVATFAATDGDRDALVYSITGADAGRFIIDAGTGALSFVTSPNFEAPADADRNNLYQLTVTASDGSLSTSKAVTIDLLNLNEDAYFTSNGGGDTASLTVMENSQFNIRLTSADPDARPSAVTYTIVGGADAALFRVATLSENQGILYFASAPDFETRRDADRNGVYEVVVSVGDGFGTPDTQTLFITVGNVNEPASFTSPIRFAIGENGANVGVVAASDVDGDRVSYAIAGGADASLFAIDAATGALSFIAAPDFERPADAGRNNVYDVRVGASDGALTSVQDIAVTIGNVVEGVRITSGGGDAMTIDVGENGGDVTTVSAINGDAGPVTYAIAGGADAALFAIDAGTGRLSFRAAPDFEAPADANRDGVYDVVVAAGDGVNAPDTQTLAVRVTNANEGPAITSGSAYAVTENAAAVGDVGATDPDGQAVTFAIAGGTDAALFAIDGATGALRFIAAPDFESPSDADGDGVYDVVVSASDGSLVDARTLSVTVANVVEAPVITSDGANDAAALDVAENGTAVTTVAAAGGEAGPVSFAIAGGADAARFAIDAISGALRFVDAPDREAADDADGDNVYDVVVTARNGALGDTQAIAVRVGGVDEAPVVDAVTAFAIGENATIAGTVGASDPEGAPIAYAIAGGADAGLFAIDPATGALRFLAAPNHEAPADVGGDNRYGLRIAASDGGLVTERDVTVTVGDVDEDVAITGGVGTIDVGENTRRVATVTAVDPDGKQIAYTLSGADASLFAIDAAGELRFVATPDFEAPADADRDNRYELFVSASDGTSIDTDALTVVVGNANEGVVITSAGGGERGAISIVENGTALSNVAARDADGDRPTFAITGGADAARFAIDAATGALRFVAAPDFEAPADADGDNFYDVAVSASDGILSDTQILSVVVTNADERAVIVSSDGADAATFTVSENGTIVAAIAARDPDGTAVTYAIAGGADAARFAIDAVNGTLSFIAAPDFEKAGDVGGDGTYDVVVSAGTGDLLDTQAVAVRVANVDEAPAFAAPGLSLAARENGTNAGTVRAIDPDGDPLAYAIGGGADGALFAIDANSGALRFLTAPDFESAADADRDGVYDVVVTASDGRTTASQSVAVRVGNVDEALSITSNGGGAVASVSVAENSRGVLTVAATDPDRGTIAYSIAGGADAARFTIDGMTGALSFVAAPDHEAPADANRDNVYDVVVRASDGAFADDQAVAVTVANVAEGATIFGTSANNTITTTTTVTGQSRATALEDSIFGGGGADTISGGGGADVIDGGAGNDVLRGQGGADRLTGGTGADSFVFDFAGESVAGAADVVTDFSRSDRDRISVNPIDANVNLSGNQNFAFIGTGAFTGAAGQLRFEQVNGNTFVSGDTNGDRIADFLIEVTGRVDLIASDFVL